MATLAGFFLLFFFVCLKLVLWGIFCVVVWLFIGCEGVLVVVMWRGRLYLKVHWEELNMILGN